jgi:dipeptidyl aminopeptidase/acylaminoacyl peptidase
VHVLRLISVLTSFGLFGVGLAAGQTSESASKPITADTVKSKPSAVPLSEIRTVAEQSDYRLTAKYDEVREYLRQLASASPLVRLSDIGASGEGRDIPMVLLADPPVASAEEAKRSGKLIIAMIGGIHSGECDGKEALLALARDIAAQRQATKGQSRNNGDAAKEETGGPIRESSLNHVVLMFIPIFNPDGNENMAPGNRPGQDGPEIVGRRENAAGLDLNRDFVKLEAPETRGLVRMLNQYDPAVFIDTHTTNGSYHRYALTFDTNKNPAGDAALTHYARETMLPRISRAVKEKHALETFWCGNFEQDHARWETYPDDPRFGANYVGMRNRIAILTESYTYAPYNNRVDSQYKFVSACIDDAVESRDEVRKLIKAADQRASASGGDGRADDESIFVTTRSRLVKSEARTTILGFVEEERDGRSRLTEVARDYQADLYVTFATDASVVRPHAYVISAPGTSETGKVGPWISRAKETLQRHGIKVEELREDIDLDLTAYRVESITQASRLFQGHFEATVEATASPHSRRIAAGSLLIRTGQPLGTLASYLLEPGSKDGLATWNFFDDSLQIGGEFAVLRLEHAVPLITLPATDLPEDVKPKQAITFDMVYERDRAPNLSGSAAGIGAWIDDSRFLQNKGGKQYIVNAASGRAERFVDPAPIAEGLSRLPTITKSDAESIANRSGLSWNKDRTGFVVEHKGDLYYCRKDGSGACRLTSSPSTEELWTFSPDGQFVAFVRENDLWVVDVLTQTERALTTGGSDTLRRGKPDWVYMEEVLGRGRSSYWWSPDSTRIAFLEIDSSSVPVYTIVNDVPDKLDVESTRYPKVGQPNPTARVLSVSVAGGEPREVDLRDYTTQDMLILNIGWRGDSSGFIACVSNRFQTWVDVLASPADGGTPKKLFRETTKAWVDAPPQPKFLKDGSFLFQSERSGWKHYYHYSKDGALLGAVTAGEWEAWSILELDEEHNRLFISGTRETRIAEALYSVALGGPTYPAPITLLTDTNGTHRASVSPKGTYFVDSWSDAGRATRVAAFLTSDRSLVRMLDTNPVRELDRYVLGTYERVQIPMKDGFVLEGSILKPAHFDPEKRYSVWFMTYGGPQAPTIGDGWARRAADECLADAGIIVFRADPRSASGKGAVSAWTAYKQLGVQELKDIEEAIGWLCQNRWVDPSRIGMSGHSYGGFMTAYCLTHSKIFAAGIAGAPVTDWRDYDSIYTERYMLTPAENPDGYEATSVVKAAKNLHGRLLLLHGMIDDNVHPQNSTRLMRALQRASKQFDVMLYPEARHGFGGKHYDRLVLEFMMRTVGGPRDPTETTPAQSPTFAPPDPER